MLTGELATLEDAWKEFQKDVNLHDDVTKKIFFSGALFMSSEAIVMAHRGATAKEIGDRMEAFFKEGIQVLCGE